MSTDNLTDNHRGCPIKDCLTLKGKQGKIERELTISRVPIIAEGVRSDVFSYGNYFLFFRVTCFLGEPSTY